MSIIFDSDLYDLAAYITGLDSWQDSEEEIEQKILDDFSIEFDDFCRLMRKITPMIDVAQSELTSKTYKGFGGIDAKGRSIWLLKIEIE